MRNIIFKRKTYLSDYLNKMSFEETHKGMRINQMTHRRCVYRLRENRRFFSSKGISPLISTVLLISIAVLLGALIMSWSAALTKSQQSTISNKTGEALTCTSADITIKNVYVDFTSNTTRVISGLNLQA